MDETRGIMIIVLLSFGVIWTVSLSVYYRNKIKKMQIELESQNQNLRLQMVTSQIRPHFILNTLGAIRSMIRIDAEQAYDLLYDFSKYIRSNIEEKDYSKPIPFLEEMEYIDTYLKLEKLRFGDRIRIEKDFETTEFWVLPLSIQPFVENAVKHGLMEIKSDGMIWIRTRKTNQTVTILIEDNGAGFDVTMLDKKHSQKKSVGMKSAMYRIQYDMNGKCKIESSTKQGKSGTKIYIEVPVKRGGLIENNHS